MTIDPGTSLAVGEIIAARTGTPPRNLKLERKRFGGAEATETALLTARYRDRRDRPAMLRMVVKRLDGRPAREARVYENLVADHAAGIAPELLKVKTLGPDSAVIFLEAVRRGLGWSLIPEPQFLPDLEAGRLVRLHSRDHVDVPLHWQRWRLASPLLTRLTEAVHRALERDRAERDRTIRESLPEIDVMPDREFGDDDMYDEIGAPM
jgi:LysR family transcriptional regulator (chromosome initiation inhibitor)